MKKTFLIISIAAFCFSCGGSQSGSGASSSVFDNPDYIKGENLITKLDCLGCHKINETSVGPAYSLIGQKYENTEANITMLVEKIQKGGSGHWGTVPMAAHSTLSKEDATILVKYIMLLKDVK